MDESDTKESLLPALIDHASEPTQKTGSKQRYRRCRSAPTENIFAQSNGRMHQPSISVFTKLHPSCRQVAFFLGLYLGVGSLCFYFVKDQIRGKKTNGVLDAIYFCVVTMTTVGYGDLVPDSVATKVLACAFVFAGIALVGLVLNKAADYLVEREEILLVRALHIRRKVGNTEIVKEIVTNKVKYKLLTTLILLFVLIIVGTIVLVRVENLDLVDAFYCICSTITTLGYGDKSFSTVAGRIFAVCWILTSTICLAQFFLYLAELHTEQRRQSLVKWVLTRRTTYGDLEEADLDHDGVVSAAEFILFKLKEMEKINEEDIALVMEEFEELDIDQTGTLSATDIKLGQSSQAET